jgi:hypothetical protein
MVIALLLLAGCSSRPASLPEAGPAQGIRGRVIKLTGDFTIEPPTGKQMPQSAPVHVFRGRLQPLDAPDPKHPALVKILQADKEGRFEIALPPGEYTLVAEIDGKLYINSWMDDGCWAVVKVKPGKWTDYVIENVLEATF